MKEKNVIDFNTAKEELKSKDEFISSSELSEEQKALTEKRKENLKKLPQYRGEVRSKNSLRKMPKLKVGDIFWVELDQQAAIVDESKKGHVTFRVLDETASISLGMTVYELNKAMSAKSKPIDLNAPEALTPVIEFIKTTLDKPEAFPNFYLAYGREIHYLTLYIAEYDTNSTIEEMADGMISILTQIGDILSIDPADHAEALEIWIRTKEEPATLVYIMPYNDGVVYL